jgi:hypothetical protein
MLNAIKLFMIIASESASADNGKKLPDHPVVYVVHLSSVQLHLQYF